MFRAPRPRFLIAYDELGNEQITFHGIQSDVLETPTSVALKHPWIHAGVANNGNIQMCQLRGLPNQCDYAVGSLAAGAFTAWVAPGAATGIEAVETVDPWKGDPATYFAFGDYGLVYDPLRLYLPLEGSVDFGSHIPQVNGVPVPGGVPMDCKIKVINSANFYLVKDLGGGFCQTSTTFRAKVKADAVNPRIANFKLIVDFDRANLALNGGGKPVDCSSTAIIGSADPNNPIDHESAPWLTTRRTLWVSRNASGHNTSDATAGRAGSWSAHTHTVGR